MAISLHPQCRKRLTEIVASVLAEMQTQNGMFVDVTAIPEFIAADKVIPATGPVRNNLNTFVGEQPILSFVLSEVNDELRRLNKFLADTPAVKLTEISGFEDPLAAAGRLVSKLESLPRHYSFSFRLQDELSALLGEKTEKNIGDRLRLVRPDKALIEKYPLFEPDPQDGFARALLGTLTKDAWDQSAVYLQLTIDGFAGSYGMGETNFVVPRTLKAFFGLGWALSLFRFERQYHPRFFGQALVSKLVRHRQRDDGSWELDEARDVDEVLSRAILGMKLHAIASEYPHWTDEKLSDMSLVLSPGTKGEPIKLACQWLFDAVTGADDLQSYVQAMIVLEILLGDKKASDEIGLGRLLGNRCAYAVGQSHEERSKILRDFQEIYQVRSDIVHSGKHRLSLQERALWGQLLRLCCRVIQKEVILLKAAPGG